MSFKSIFGVTPKTRILDFLAEHPDHKYSLQLLNKKCYVVLLSKYVQELVNNDLICMIGSSYKINKDNTIVKSVLKHDYEKAKLELEKQKE